MAASQMQNLIPASTSSVVTIQTQNALPNQMQYGVLDQLNLTQLQCGYVTLVAAVKIDVENVQNQQQNQSSMAQLQCGCLSPIAAART